MATVKDITVKKTRQVIQIAERANGDRFFKAVLAFQSSTLLAKTVHIENDKTRNEMMALMETQSEYSTNGIVKKLALYALESGVLPHELYK